MLSLRNWMSIPVSSLISFIIHLPRFFLMEKVLSGYVGFGNLPSQVSHKSIFKGFEFSLMVVGASGLGKSTLVNSLFLSDIYSQKPYCTRIPQTTSIHSTKVNIYENEINLDLTLVDTPGYGDLINNDDCWKPIVRYITDRYEEYLENESQIRRSSFEDRRVHCCLYFISPNGHGLKDIDISFMKILHEKVNLIPIIAKADTLSPEELLKFKARVLQDIKINKINIYDFSYKLGLTDNDFGTNNRFIERMPFGVVGSCDVFDVEGKLVRGRKYPWGIIDINNIDHCDFSLLRDVLVRYHMQNLKDIVHCNLYENFRACKLGYSSKVTDSSNKCPDFDNIDTMESIIKNSTDIQEMNRLHEHNQLLDELSKEKSKIINDLLIQHQKLENERFQFSEEKENFEIEHANFIKSVSETGRSTSISAKKNPRKKI